MKSTLIAFLVFLSFPFFAESQSKKDKKDMTGVAEKMNNGNYEAARTEVEAYLQKKQDNITAWILSGHIYSELDEDSSAMISYQRALQIDSTSEQALTGLGILYRKKGDYNIAAGYYYQAIRFNPAYAQAYSSLVVIELKRKNFSKAVEVGLKGFELDNTDPIIVSNLSIAYHYANDTSNRDKYYEMAKKMGYKKLDALKKIFSGELTIFDD